MGGMMRGMMRGMMGGMVEFLRRSDGDRIENGWRSDGDRMERRERARHEKNDACPRFGEIDPYCQRCQWRMYVQVMNKPMIYDGTLLFSERLHSGVDQ